MNLLFCIPNADDFEEVLNHLEAAPKKVGELVSTSFLAHQVDILLTGETTEETTNSLTKIFAQKRYHLVLYAGFSESWKAEISVGEIVNVIREKTSADESFVNRTNNYINIFFEFRKVLSAAIETEPKADIETRNGAVLTFACVRLQQPFYQVRAVEKNNATGESDKEKAKKVLNETLIQVLNLI